LNIATKRLPWFEIILSVVVMSISVYAALSDAQNFSLRWFTRDDAYYYFKVAQNISEGHGSTFDGINLTNGYHPLWMLVCIPIFALARFDPVLPLRVLLIVLSALSISTAIMLYRLIGKILSPVIGALAAIYWVFSFDILINLYMQGLESGIAAFFVVLLLYKIYQFERNIPLSSLTYKHYLVLGIIGALTIFSRLDLIFFVMIAGFWVVFRGHTIRYFLPLDVIAAMVSVFLSFILRLELPEYYDFSNIATAMALLSLVIKIPAAYLFGLYQKNILLNLRVMLPRIIATMLISTALLTAAMLAMSQIELFQGFPRMVLVLDLGFFILFFAFSRIMYIVLHNQKAENPNPQTPMEEIFQNWRKWATGGIAYFGAAFGALSIYMVWNKLIFGTFSPVSGQIKRWWGSFPARVYGGATRSPLEFFGIDFQGDGLAWTPVANTIGGWINKTSEQSLEVQSRYVTVLIGISIFYFLLLIFNKDKSRTALVGLTIIPLVCGSILQAVYYHSSGYAAFKEWYWVTQRIATVLLMCLPIGILFTSFRRFISRNYAGWAIAGLIAFNMGSAYWTGIKVTMQYDRWSSDTPMMEIASVLEANTEPGSLIGFTGGGNVGYFIHDRTVINMDGLINSKEYFDALQDGSAGSYLADLGLDYVLANPGILDRMPYDGQFDEYLTPTGVSYGGKQLMKYNKPK
jgi:hypothetical protein